jgi:hypothetical protein
MEVMLLIALVALMVAFAARAIRDQRVAVRVPARVNQRSVRRRQ